MPATEPQPLCAYCRERDAIGWLSDADGGDWRRHEQTKEPICLQCLAALFEREQALAIADAAGKGDRLRELLPPLRRGLGARSARPSPARTDDAEELDDDDPRTKLERIAAGYEAFLEHAEREGRRLDEELEP